MAVDSIYLHLFTSMCNMCRGANKMGMGQTFGGWTSGIHMYSPRALTHSHILVYWVVIPVTSRYSILDLHRLYHQLSFWLKINPHNRIVFFISFSLSHYLHQSSCGRNTRFSISRLIFPAFKIRKIRSVPRNWGLWGEEQKSPELMGLYSVIRCYKL